jgi:hypothetical protein
MLKIDTKLAQAFRLAPFLFSQTFRFGAVAKPTVSEGWICG